MIYDLRFTIYALLGVRGELAGWIGGGNAA
jgi:hypothetical protein